MLVCSKRKLCEKRSGCSHAIKHLESDCKHVTFSQCPDGMQLHHRHGKDRRCKVTGSKLHRIANKALISKSKVKIHIIQYEAQQAVSQLRNMALVEQRMAGKKVQKKDINMLEIIQGLSSTYIRELFPDAVQRGLSKVHVINALNCEINRQRNLINLRRIYHRNTDDIIKSNRDRLWKITLKNKDFFDSMIRKHYVQYSRHLPETRLEYMDRDSLILPNFKVTKYKRYLEFNLQVPKAMVLKDIQNHIVICDHEFKNATDFPCFALVGKSDKTKMAMTEVVNNQFIDKTI